jgi:hypothetical protein
MALYGVAAQRKAGPGRAKGSQNKISKEAKEVIAQAAAELGGAKRLVEWAQSSPKREDAFWTMIYPRLVAVTVTGPGANGEHFVHTIERRIVEPGD